MYHVSILWPPFRISKFGQNFVINYSKNPYDAFILGMILADHVERLILRVNWYWTMISCINKKNFFAKIFFHRVILYVV